MKWRIEPDVRRPGRAKLFIACERGASHASGQGRECAFSLWQQPARGATWQWDGNVEAPTITPSIDCHGGCARGLLTDAAMQAQ